MSARKHGWVWNAEHVELRRSEDRPSERAQPDDPCNGLPTDCCLHRSPHRFTGTGCDANDQMSPNSAFFIEDLAQFIRRYVGLPSAHLPGNGHGSPIPYHPS